MEWLNRFYAPKVDHQPEFRQNCATAADEALECKRVELRPLDIPQEVPKTPPVAIGSVPTPVPSTPGRERSDSALAILSSSGRRKMALRPFSLPETWHLSRHHEPARQSISRSYKHDYRNPEAQYDDDISRLLRRMLERWPSNAAILNRQAYLHPYLSKDYLRNLQCFGLLPSAYNSTCHLERDDDDGDICETPRRNSCATGPSVELQMRFLEPSFNRRWTLHSTTTLCPSQELKHLSIFRPSQKVLHQTGAMLKNFKFNEL